MKILVAGPQGSGKSSIAEQVKAKHPDLPLIDEWHSGIELPDNCIVLTHCFDKVYWVEKDNPPVID